MGLMRWKKRKENWDVKKGRGLSDQSNDERERKKGMSRTWQPAGEVKLGFWQNILMLKQSARTVENGA